MLRFSVKILQVQKTQKGISLEQIVLRKPNKFMYMEYNNGDE